MNIQPSERNLITILGLILVAGFLGINIFSYHVSSHSVKETLVKNELPLTSNNIYSEIQASLLRPIHISSLMAHDTFLKDWMLGGEEDVEKVTKYLKEIKKKYEVFSTFVVSGLTLRYYHFSGVLKTMDGEDAKDQWFFTMEPHPKDYRVDVDTNEAADNRLTIFVNHKIYDYDDRFIGVTGLGLDVATVSHLIEHYKARYDRDIYFVDPEGTIKSHGDGRFVDRMNIRDQPGLGQVAPAILADTEGSVSYEGENGRTFLRYRFIPELNWYLMVEQAEQEALAPLRRSFLVNLAAGGVITLLVLGISGFTIHRFQSTLEQMARTDKLSGLYNRQYFEALFENTAASARRNKRRLSLLLFDIDLFKEINDQYGHLKGDGTIRAVAKSVRANRRETDIFCRWGGDEFAILLPDCGEPDARQIAEELRSRVKEEVRTPGGDREITLSIGLAEFRPDEKLEDLISRADAGLYAAKKGGRDRVETGPAQADVAREGA